MAKENSATQILNGLREPLENYGFKQNKSEKEFRRRTDFGFQRVLLTGRSPSRGQAATGLPLYECTIILQIRFESVETILLPLELIIGNKNQKNASTVSRVIYGYYPFRRFRDRPIKIGYKNPKKDLEKVIIRAQKMLSSDGQNWFKKYSDIQACETEINSAPAWEATNLIANSERRIYNGIALTALCKGSEYANEIAGKYVNALHQIKNIPPDSRKRVENKINILCEQV